jgi:outer membrane receptor protein involved in Fe transport
VANAFGNGFSTGNLVIRGSAPEDSMYLLDGIEIPLIYHFGGLQTVLPAEMIDDIEFLPGGFGVENGRATGGIVHIHTRPSTPKKLEGFAELSFINVAGHVQGPLWREQNLSFALGFRRSVIDAILPAVVPDDANLTFTTMPQYYDAEARIDWVPAEHHRVSAFGLFSLDRLSLISANENALDPALTGEFDAEAGVGVGVASWKYRTKELDSTATVSFSKMQLEQALGETHRLNIDSPTVALREELVWRAHPRASLRVGGDVLVNESTFDVVMPLPPQEGMPGEPNFTTDPLTIVDDVIDDVWASAYVASDLKPIKKLTVTPGLRLDRYDHLGATTLSPRLSARFRLSPRWVTRAAVGEYTRPLTGAEYVATGVEPERAIHYVTGADYEVAEGVSATASAFYTDTRDLVVQDRSLIETDALDAYVNRGTGRAYGAEFMLRAKRKNFFGWLTYTASRSTRKDEPSMSSRLFDHDQTHNFIAVGSYRWGPWSFGGRWQLSTGEPITPVTGSQYLTDIDAYQPTYGETNSDRLETAHKLDLRVDRTWTFDTWSLSGYLDVSNVYANARTLGYQYNFDYTEREESTDIPILPAIGIRGAF